MRNYKKTTHGKNATKLCNKLTSGAIQGKVPTRDIFVVLANNRDVPKSQIYSDNTLRNLLIQYTTVVTYIYTITHYYYFFQFLSTDFFSGVTSAGASFLKAAYHSCCQTTTVKALKGTQALTSTKKNL